MLLLGWFRSCRGCVHRSELSFNILQLHNQVLRKSQRDQKKSKLGRKALTHRRKMRIGCDRQIELRLSPTCERPHLKQAPKTNKSRPPGRWFAMLRKLQVTTSCHLFASSSYATFRKASVYERCTPTVFGNTGAFGKETAKRPPRRPQREQDHQETTRRPPRHQQETSKRPARGHHIASRPPRDQQESTGTAPGDHHKDHQEKRQDAIQRTPADHQTHIQRDQQKATHQKVSLRGLHNQMTKPKPQGPRLEPEAFKHTVSQGWWISETYQRGF